MRFQLVFIKYVLHHLKKNPKYVPLKKPKNEFFASERTNNNRLVWCWISKCAHDVVARHASRGADSKLSNAVDDGIFDHVFFSQFSSSFVVE